MKDRKLNTKVSEENASKKILIEADMQSHDTLYVKISLSQSQKMCFFPDNPSSNKGDTQESFIPTLKTTFSEDDY